MKRGYLHICVVLDASGSMGAIANDVKGTFDSFIDEQRKEPGQTVLDVYQFADKSTRIVKSANLANFSDDLMARYSCRGCTALNDAVCGAIDEIGAEFAGMPESERPEKVVFAILTDGEENASRKFRATDVKKRIDEQTNVYNWSFVYLAANVSAVDTGAAMGLRAEDCVDFCADSAGLKNVQKTMRGRAAAARSEMKRD